MDVLEALEWMENPGGGGPGEGDGAVEIPPRVVIYASDQGETLDSDQYAIWYGNLLTPDQVPPVVAREADERRGGGLAAAERQGGGWGLRSDRKQAVSPAHEAKTASAPAGNGGGLHVH
jgi:hypothetical protein